jgi:hypothetical protein
MHKRSDPALTLPLFLTSQPHEALAEWGAWSEVLGTPRVLAKERRLQSRLRISGSCTQNGHARGVAVGKR